VIVLSLTKQLLDLQQADAKVHEVVTHLERLAAHRHQLEARVAQERANVAALRDALQKLELDSRARNLEVDELDARIRAYQERLDKGIISFKEMEDLRVKIASEKVHIGHLEDEALDLMTSIETARANVAQAQVDHGPREEHLLAQVAAIDQETRETEQGRLADLRGERTAVAAAMPAYALAQYEALRVTFSNPVAAIDHGTCGGCKIRVSANTVERVRAGREVVTCEHCSRILFSL
jgi:predicted  nucleic acid-binding Zn-ribbon protein